MRFILVGMMLLLMTGASVTWSYRQIQGIVSLEGSEAVAQPQNALFKEGDSPSDSRGPQTPDAKLPQDSACNVSPANTSQSTTERPAKQDQSKPKSKAAGLLTTMSKEDFENQLRQEKEKLATACNSLAKSVDELNAMMRDHARRMSVFREQMRSDSKIDWGKLGAHSGGARRPERVPPDNPDIESRIPAIREAAENFDKQVEAFWTSARRIQFERFKSLSADVRENLKAADQLPIPESAFDNQINYGFDLRNNLDFAVKSIVESYGQVQFDVRSAVMKRSPNGKPPGATARKQNDDDFEIDN